MRILLADDNLINQKIVSKMLHKLGYEARVVDNGLQVLATLREGTYDLILLDMMMPELDGYATARAIRNGEAGEEARQIHIVALTGHGEEEKPRCLAAGTNAFLSKPMRVEDLHRVLQEACIYPTKPAKS
jgi:CheY-like chemotaxis protein